MAHLPVRRTVSAAAGEPQDARGSVRQPFDRRGRASADFQIERPRIASCSRRSRHQGNEVDIAVPATGSRSAAIYDPRVSYGFTVRSLPERSGDKIRAALDAAC